MEEIIAFAKENQILLIIAAGVLFLALATIYLIYRQVMAMVKWGFLFLLLLLVLGGGYYWYEQQNNNSSILQKK